MRKAIRKAENDWKRGTKTCIDDFWSIFQTAEKPLELTNRSCGDHGFKSVMFKEKLCVFIPAKVGKYNGSGYINIKIYPVHKNKCDKRFIMPTYPKVISISEKHNI